MSRSFGINQIAVLAIISICLFFSLRNAILQMPVQIHSFDLPSSSELIKMAPLSLENLLKGLLEQVRSGKAISHGREQALRDIMRAIPVTLASDPELVARLLAIIEEILELNSELIYPEDGEARTDNDH
ncbi:MAG: hypothetical protein J5I98_15345 [Phaeodactylibacter sp.]|nr:hypothetical protein [Phaeodactylibacter sp.]